MDESPRFPWHDRNQRIGQQPHHTDVWWGPSMAWAYMAANRKVAGQCIFPPSDRFNSHFKPDPENQ